MDSGLAVPDKAGDRLNPAPYHLPPLLRHHISSSGIALTPFPNLDKIKQGKGVKGGNGAPVEPSFVKSLGITNAVPIISPLEEFQKPLSQMELHEMEELHHPPEFSVNKGTTGSNPLVPNFASAAASANAAVIPAVSNFSSQNFQNRGVPKAPHQSETDNGNGAVESTGPSATASAIESGKAADSRGNKFQPFACSIDPQPLDCAERNFGPSVVSGLSALGCIPLNGSQSKHSNGPSDLINVKGRGNLGFEFFKGPYPVDLQYARPKSCCGLDQNAEAVDGLGQLQPGLPSTTGPSLLTHEDSPHEDKEHSDSDDSDYFGYYHSDGDFPEDTD